MFSVTWTALFVEFWSATRNSFPVLPWNKHGGKPLMRIFLRGLPQQLLPGNGLFFNAKSDETEQNKREFARRWCRNVVNTNFDLIACIFGVGFIAAFELIHQHSFRVSAWPSYSHLIHWAASRRCQIDIFYWFLCCFFQPHQLWIHLAIPWRFWLSVLKWLRNVLLTPPATTATSTRGWWYGYSQR